jgi:hypothetical protein
LKPGEVYHQADLKAWSTSVDRHLQELIMDKIITKALTLDQSILRSLAEKFGKVVTRKLFRTPLAKSK